MRSKHADVLTKIRTEQALSSDIEAKLKEVLDGYAKTFVAA